MCSCLCNTYYYILYNVFNLPTYIDEPTNSNDYNEYLVKSKMNIIENPIYMKR